MIDESLLSQKEMEILANKKDYLPVVSVIIATYDRYSCLENALMSLVSQTYKNIEIIIVDDNGGHEQNEKVESIVKTVRKRFGCKMLYLKNEINKGSAETRNIGIRAASGEYITFLDDDDVYLPNKVENQVKHMLEEGSVYSITDLMLYNEDDKLIEYRKRMYIKSFDSNYLLKYHLMYHMTGTDTMMFKSDYLINIGCFDQIDVGDEFYLMLKAIFNGGKFSYLPICDVRAYIHSETEGLSSGDSKIRGENELFQYKKQFFNILNYSEKRYIIMRHYAVLSYAEYRRKRFNKFISYALLSFFASPINCVKEFVKIVINR
ncbi:glycosyltransferase family 2 protein [Candidatus Pristimantibacillus sp. PTI5]|uniref:glycosyltransferase family 2 protein n=1 Tax=Candidatus Pristimantibacillus sp. PTI5 TaxID=3400422 RepID=UPI003B018416